MKYALICYHKNLSTLYPQNWIDDFRTSILNQSHKDFDIFELCYGSSGERIFEESQYIMKQCETFVHGMNYLIELAISQGYDYIFNTNVDDYYSPLRIERQLPYLIEGYDIVSSNFMLVRNEKNYLRQEFNDLNLETELTRSHNIIAHPSVAYSKNFFTKCEYRPEEIPTEDLLLWQRGIKEGMKFKIVPEILLYHRLHDKMVSGTQTDRAIIT